MARRLVELLMHTSYSVQTPALRTIGNIVTGDDVQTQVVLQVAALPCLLALLGSARKGIRKEACWTISNITAGNKGQVIGMVVTSQVLTTLLSANQIQAVIDCSIIQPLIQLLSSAEWDIRKEAAWAISNATSGGTPDQLRYLLSQNCIPPLCELLVCADVRIIIVALEALENLLKVGVQDAQKYGSNRVANFIEDAGGLDKIEGLQVHPNHEVYDKVIKVSMPHSSVCFLLLLFACRFWKRTSTRRRRSRLRPLLRKTRAQRFSLARVRRRSSPALPALPAAPAAPAARAARRVSPFEGQ